MESLLHTHLKAVRFIGLWNGRRRGAFSIAMFAFFVLVLSTQLVALAGARDFPETAANASVSLLCMVIAAKIATVFLNHERVVGVMCGIMRRETVLMGSHDKIKGIVEQNLKENRVVTKSFWTMASLTILGFIIKPCVERLAKAHVDKLVFSSWFPFDVQRNRINYICAYVLQVAYSLQTTYYVCAWDMLTVALIMHAIGSFRVLQYKLKNLHTDYRTGEIWDSNSSADAIEENLRHCLREHCEIILYIQDINALINTVMYFEFFVFSVIVCAVGFEAIVGGMVIELGVIIQYLVTLLAELFLFCWYGSKLTSEVWKFYTRWGVAVITYCKMELMGE